MIDLTVLNSYQLEAVTDESPACLVNAAVGSGKTTVLTAKVQYLCQEKQVSPQELMVLTFTNKAADEIRERLKDSMDGQENLWFGTFHSVALRMLQTILPVEELGYTRQFQVCVPEEEMQIAQQLILEKELKIKYKNRLRKRLEQSRQKNGRKGKDYGDDFERLCTLLSEEKKRQDKMTYDELIQYAGQLLRNHPEIPRPHWLIIDEVQDCDQNQLNLLEDLLGEGSHLFAVGDPNQVIYSWRGSAFQIFFQLKSRYQARELHLPVNYRSSGTILSAAKRFLQNAGPLEGVQDAGAKIQVRREYNPFQEADDLAGRIRELHAQGIAYRDIGILYRLQSQSVLLEQVLMRNQITVQVTVKEKIEEIPVAQWFFHVLRFLANHRDLTSGVQALCNKTYGEGWSQKKALQLFRRWEQEQVMPENSPLFYGMVHFQEETCSLDELQKFLSLDRYLGTSRASYDKDKKMLEGIVQRMKKKGSIRDFLNDAALSGMTISDICVPEEASGKDENKDAVSLMTLHASKGLEFSCVFIIGVNDGLIPLRGNAGEQEEEERRLFFVGLTRARERLELTYYTSPDGYGVFPGPGRYLKMLPADLVEGLDTVFYPEGSAAEHLQAIKREVLQARLHLAGQANEEEKKESMVSASLTAEEKDEHSSKETDALPQIRVSHAKYGTGTVLSEDDTTIVIRFDDYGEKELLKMFTEITRL